MRVLISAIALYQHEFFRSQSQRDSYCSLRAAVSPDGSLAYIDFLCDKADSPCRPMGPLGQPNLPLSLRFSGLGSYFLPWMLDTNDIILQAVGHSPDAATFIDESWITFVVELNKLLKTINRLNCHAELPTLINFLEQETNHLGGLVLEFCTFSNLIGGRHKLSGLDGSDNTSERSWNQSSGSHSSSSNGRPSLSVDNTIESFSDRRSEDNGNLFADWLRKKRQSSNDQNATSRFSQHSTMSQSLGISQLTNLSKIDEFELETVQPTVPTEFVDLDDVDFSDMCFAISTGKLVPGIKISHKNSESKAGPSVLPDVDDDLESVVLSSPIPVPKADNHGGRNTDDFIDNNNAMSPTAAKKLLEIEKYKNIVRAAELASSPDAPSSSPHSSQALPAASHAVAEHVKLDKKSESASSYTSELTSFDSLSRVQTQRPSNGAQSAHSKMSYRIDTDEEARNIGPPSANLNYITTWTNSKIDKARIVSSYCASELSEFGFHGAVTRETSAASGSARAQSRRRTSANLELIEAGGRSFKRLTYLVAYQLQRFTIGINCMPKGSPRLVPYMTASLFVLCSLDSFLAFYTLIYFW